MVFLIVHALSHPYDNMNLWTPEYRIPEKDIVGDDVREREST
jgi:hypothetical protein